MSVVTAFWSSTPILHLGLGAALRYEPLQLFEIFAYVLLGVLSLRVDLGFQAFQAAFDICELEAKLFEELIDALSYEEVSCWCDLQ